MKNKKTLTIAAAGAITIIIIAIVLISCQNGKSKETAGPTNSETRTAKLINPPTTSEETTVGETKEEAKNDDNKNDNNGTEETTKKKKKKKKDKEEETTTGYVEVGSGNNFAYDIFTDDPHEYGTISETVDPSEFAGDDAEWSDFY